MDDEVITTDSAANDDAIVAAVAALQSDGWTGVRARDHGAYIVLAGFDAQGNEHSAHTARDDDPRDTAQIVARLRGAAAAMLPPPPPSGMDFVASAPLADPVIPPPAPPTLEEARAALQLQLMEEAARRASQPVTLYQTVTRLAAIPESERTPDQVLQLLQHASWASARDAVEAARAAKAAEIDALETIDAIAAYDVTAGWPF